MGRYLLKTFSPATFSVAFLVKLIDWLFIYNILAIKVDAKSAAQIFFYNKNYLLIENKYCPFLEYLIYEGIFALNEYLPDDIDAPIQDHVESYRQNNWKINLSSFISSMYTRVLS